MRKYNWTTLELVEHENKLWLRYVIKQKDKLNMGADGSCEMSSLYGEWIITLDIENSGTLNEKVRRPLQMPKMRRFQQWKQEIQKTRTQVKQGRICAVHCQGYDVTILSFFNQGFLNLLNQFSKYLCKCKVEFDMKLNWALIWNHWTLFDQIFIINTRVHVLLLPAWHQLRKRQEGEGDVTKQDGRYHSFYSFFFTYSRQEQKRTTKN